MGRLERKYLAHYIDANMSDGVSTNYVRLGKDLEAYSEELNPQVSVQRDIRGLPYVTLTGYQVQSDADTYYADPENPLFAPLSSIANNRLTDDYCQTTKVDVLVDGNGNQLWAFREECWIVPNSVGGDTTGVQIPFSVYCAGNRVYGTYDVNSRIFTPSDEPYDPEPAGGVVSLTVTQNGTYEAPDGYTYNPVYVNVGQNVEPLEVTSNGYYENEYGFSPVNVNVPQTATGRENAIIERTITGTYENNELTKIGTYAFAGASISAIVANGCLSIGGYAFAHCGGLVSAEFSNCTVVGDFAFQSATRLNSVSLPECITINNGAFLGAYDMTTISLPKVTSIGSAAFYGCTDLTEISAPLLRSIYGSSTSGAFYRTKLQSVYFPSLVSLGAAAFSSCTSLSRANLPVCTIVGSYAFFGCNLLSDVSFPACVSVGTSAFTGCTELRELSLPNCSRIDNYAFRNCRNLISLYLMSTSVVTLGGSSAFLSTPIGGYSDVAGRYGSIYVPAELLSSYLSTGWGGNPWSYFSERFVGI